MQCPLLSKKKLYFWHFSFQDLRLVWYSCVSVGFYQIFSVLCFTFSEKWSHGTRGTCCRFRYTWLLSNLTFFNFLFKNYLKFANNLITDIYFLFPFLFFCISFSFRKKNWNTEFNQVLQNDACRLQQLQCHTSAPGHSFNKFFWGKAWIHYFSIL